MPAALRWVARRILHAAVPWLPSGIRQRVARLPYSRFSRTLPRVFGGVEEMTWEGVRLTVDPGELFGFWFYFMSRGFQDEELRWLRQATDGAGVFADVGAHVGIYSLALARHNSNLRVYAFEPSRAIVERIRQHLRLNPNVASRIAVEELAISDRDGDIGFEEAGSINSGVGHVAPIPGGRPVSRVRAVTLASYFAGLTPPDVVKIDVEGHERAVLSGMDGLSRLPRAILVELHPPGKGEADERDQVLDWLEHRGYRCEFLADDLRMIPIRPRVWPDRVHVLAKRGE